ncbi:MAG TPA: hypothetical protein VMV83_13470 [Rectinemataceae bacterium]|nr:hypothetical protein [Rectinemataceae bacterium]
MKSQRGPLVSAPLLFLLLMSTALTGGGASAEDLRTLIGASIVLPQDPQGVQVSIAYNEAVGISWSKDLNFVQGFEIEVKSPAAALAMPGSIAWEMWKNVDPVPDKNHYGYSGDRILTQVLPGRAGVVYQIPTRGDNNLKDGPFATVLPTVVDPASFPFVFRLIPISKGSTPDVERAKFSVRVRPLFTDEGGLRVGFKYPAGVEKGDFSVQVDGSEVDPSGLLVLKPGSHSLHVASTVYREESRSFSIEQGRVLDMSIELEDTTPILFVEAPDSAVLSLDGSRLDRSKTSFTVEPGEHTVLCRLGDYSMTRKFTAYRGKSYRLVLSIDLAVQEVQ